MQRVFVQGSVFLHVWHMGQPQSVWGQEVCRARESGGAPKFDVSSCCLAVFAKKYTCMCGMWVAPGCMYRWHTELPDCTGPVAAVGGYADLPSDESTQSLVSCGSRHVWAGRET
jgi:hypothetical protein